MTHFVQSRWLYLFFVVIVGGVAGGWLQAAEQSSTELPAPTIRVTTHLVLIDLWSRTSKAIRLPACIRRTSW